MAGVAATAGSPIARTLRVHLVARHLLSSLHFDHSELASSTSSLGRRSCCAGHPAWLSTGRWWPPMLGWSTPAQAARTQTHTVAKPLCTLHKARTQVQSRTAHCALHEAQVASNAHTQHTIAQISEAALLYWSFQILDHISLGNEHNHIIFCRHRHSDCGSRHQLESVCPSDVWSGLTLAANSK